MASPESHVALEFGHYQDTIRDRAFTILAEEGFAVDDGDAVVDVLAFAVLPRTEAAITAFLDDNEIHDRDEHTDEIIEEVYRSGLRMHALVTYLGQNGIRLVAASEDGHAEQLIVGTMGDFEKGKNKDRSLLALMVDAVQDSLVEESDIIEERSELAGNSAQQVQHVGMFAINKAILDIEMELTHSTEEDLMNRGAQLFCILASVQSAKGRIFFVDSQGYGLPLVDNLNDVAKGPPKIEDSGNDDVE